MKPSSTLTILAYIALALTWGSSFLLMKVALDAFAPAQVAIGRILIGATTLTLLMTVTRRSWPRERRLWGHLTIIATFLCVIPFLLFAWAETQLSSGIGAILNSTTPIWTGIATVILIRGTRLTTGQCVGISLGALGVLITVGGWQLLTDPSFITSLPAQSACLGATASYGLALAWMQRFANGRHSYDAGTIATVQMVAAASLCLPLVPFLALRPVEIAWPPALSLATLGMLGTGLAYVWGTRIVAAWGSVAASTVTYLTPIVGVILGIIVLGERVSWHEPVGTLVILLSVMLVQRRRLRLPAWRARTA